MRRLLIPLLFATVTPAHALSTERLIYESADGIIYIWNVTTQGDIFLAPETSPDDLFILTPDCVAQNATHGTGSWGVDDAGWQIAFNNRYQITFPGTMPPLDPANCMMLR